jgi:hypothetical protein
MMWFWLAYERIIDGMVVSGNGDALTFCDWDFSSASRLSLLCSSGELQGVQLHIEQVEKGRPFRLMRINGRSGNHKQGN